MKKLKKFDRKIFFYFVIGVVEGIKQKEINF